MDILTITIVENWGWSSTQILMFFLKKVQTALPSHHPLVLEISLRFFRKYTLTCVNLQWNFWIGDDPLPPLSPLFGHFFQNLGPKYIVLKPKICKVIFWIWNEWPYPPFGPFSKKHPYLSRWSPLTSSMQLLYRTRKQGAWVYPRPTSSLLSSGVLHIVWC